MQNYGDKASRNTSAAVGKPMSDGMKPHTAPVSSDAGMKGDAKSGCSYVKPGQAGRGAHAIKGFGGGVIDGKV